jgi:hypothetical protein
MALIICPNTLKKMLILTPERKVTSMSEITGLIAKLIIGPILMTYSEKIIAIK